MDIWFLISFNSQFCSFTSSTDMYIVVFLSVLQVIYWQTALITPSRRTHWQHWSACPAGVWSRTWPGSHCHSSQPITWTAVQTGRLWEYIAEKRPSNTYKKVLWDTNRDELHSDMIEINYVLFFGLIGYENQLNYRKTDDSYPPYAKEGTSTWYSCQHQNSSTTLNISL